MSKLSKKEEFEDDVDDAGEGTPSLSTTSKANGDDDDDDALSPIADDITIFERKREIECEVKREKLSKTRVVVKGKIVTAEVKHHHHHHPRRRRPTLEEVGSRMMKNPEMKRRHRKR